MDRKVIEDLVNKTQRSTTDMVARVLREMAPRFSGVDGAKALQTVADAVERGGRK